MSIGDWATLPNGDIAVNPLLGFETATFPMVGILRVEFADSPQDVARMKGLHVQLGMTAAQARELGQALLRLADGVDQRR